ncbi:hypothetical protein AVEN_85813-1, partial [Araneus ventricosus]
MGRYLCQLCYTIVNYGEKHPCFDYRNDDYVYSLPELGESNKMDTKHGELTANSNDNSVIIFPEEQQNDAENPEHIHRCLTENNQAASLLNSSENFESAYRCQVVIRGASKRKSRRPVRWERNEGKKTDYISFQAATNEKCETWHDEGSWQSFIEGETCFSKSVENVPQKSQFHSKNVSAAPNFKTDFALPPRFIQTGQDVIKVSGDHSYRETHFNSITSIPKSNTCNYKGNLSSKNIPVSTGFCEKISIVHEQMLENDDEEAQHKSKTEIDSKGINKRSNVSAENAIYLASISDAVPIVGSSRMNVESQLRTEHGNFICKECGKSVKWKSLLVEH